MPALIDLTGQKFGELTVLKINREYKNQNNIVKNSETYWDCQCSCGQYCTISRTGLKKNKNLYCPECRNKKKIKDLTGQRFGKVLVIGRDYEYEAASNRSDAAWKCRCDCGREWTQFGFQIQKLKSCGSCIEREAIGKVFGELTVLEYIGKKRGPGKYNTESRFLCQCSCGNTIEVSYSHLNSGHTCTCGCGRSSYGELKIRELLIKNKLSFIPEFSPPELIGLNGGALRFDFALIDNDKKVTRLIEFDGPQHKHFTNFFHNESDFLKLQEHDKRKDNYAKINNIPLIRIPYNIRNQITIEKILSDEYLIK